MNGRKARQLRKIAFILYGDAPEGRQFYRGLKRHHFYRHIKGL